MVRTAPHIPNICCFLSDTAKDSRPKRLPALPTFLPPSNIMLQILQGQKYTATKVTRDHSLSTKKHARHKAVSLYVLLCSPLSTHLVYRNKASFPQLYE